MLEVKHGGSAKDQIVLFKMEEVNFAIERIKNRKAVKGLDGISNALLHAVHRVRPNLLQNVYNRCLLQGKFSSTWKRSRIILLRKGSKPVGVPISYRPLCLLNDIGKVAEFLFAKKVEEHVLTMRGLSPS